MKFSDLVDLTELKKVCESFTAFSGAGTAILDIEGNNLISTGWQDICVKFHRVNPVTEKRCRESDSILFKDTNKSGTYRIYKCKNGLIDVAIPIIIGDEHVATFFTGQFLFEKSDREFFTRQAEEFNFDKKAYLEALDSVPIYTEIYVMNMIEFLGHFVRMMGEAGLARKRVEVIREQLIIELDNSAKEIKTLSGLLPICAECKKIRDDEGEWIQIEEYVQNHTEVDFSHSLCPLCAKRLYPDIFR